MVKNEQPPRLPQHIAIIMDGNGRWAEKRHLPRSLGHREGQKAVTAIVKFCLQRSISTLTLFAFSSENWRRPHTEVSTLMQLFLKALDQEVHELHKNNVRITFFGDLSAFAPELRHRMEAAMALTFANTALRLNIAVNYGGRWDIVQATRHAIDAINRNELTIDAVTEQSIAPFFCLADQAPPDLFIRTGGEMRLSNFLLWQTAYSELYFTDTLWPDMDETCMDLALAQFAHRERRFGQTSAQVRHVD